MNLPLQRQIEVVVPYLAGGVPVWLVLGGPADCQEAQHARRLWPGISVLGVEPNADAVAWQLDNGWPGDGTLLHLALSDLDGKVVRGSKALDRFDMCALEGTGQYDNTNEPFLIETVTLDTLNTRFGPFNDSILWLDIEEYEVRALKGATKMLGNRLPLVINVEVRDIYERELDSLLVGNGYEAVLDWNINSTYFDRVYRRQS